MSLTRPYPRPTTHMTTPLSTGHDATSISRRLFKPLLEPDVMIWCDLQLTEDFNGQTLRRRSSLLQCLANPHSIIAANFVMVCASTVRIAMHVLGPGGIKAPALHHLVISRSWHWSCWDVVSSHKFCRTGRHFALFLTPKEGAGDVCVYLCSYVFSGLCTASRTQRTLTFQICVEDLRCQVRWWEVAIVGMDVEQLDTSSRHRDMSRCGDSNLR